MAETETYNIKINSNGKNTILFKNIPDDFYVVLGHKNSVTKLPSGAKLLASSKRCKNQAYQIKNNIFCTQFHAELDRNELVWRLSLYPAYMKGKTVEEVKKTFKPTPHSKKVIKNFINEYYK